MVAIITGKGPGIENASVSLLGGRGLLGSAAVGRAAENAYVNAATGNLVLTDMDEMLVGRGPDAAISRTYNSLGAWDGDNDDYWRAGVYRRVTGLTGGSGYGTAGSTVKRTDWDGSEATYTWNAAAGAYVSTDGAGAYDTLTRTSGVWTWTDGDTRVAEAYDDANSGRITARTDTSGNSISYTYTSGLITRVTTSNGEYTDLAYTSGRLTSLVTNSTFPTAQITRAFYEYDGSGRLSKVLVNLAPADNSKTTGTNYETSYTYDGTSKRVASIAQSDGTLLTISYALVGSDYRVSAVAQTVGGGAVRTTSFVYDTTPTNLVTTVVDPLGQVTRLSYDANGNLKQIVTPPAGADMQPIVQQFAYETDGDVASVTLGPGNTITYGYDGNGNRTFERDSAGNTISRTYGSRNELLTETHYLTPDPDGAGSGAPSGAIVANYVYDALNRPRYAVSPEGRVTEYRYDGWGQQVSKIDYTAATYGSTMTEAALNAWVAALSDRGAAQRTDTWYDFRGNVARTESYATLDVRGDGADSPLTVTSDTSTSVARQPDGLYRITKTAGTDNWSADARSLVKAEGDFVLQMRPGQTDKYTAAGVAVTPGAGSSDPNLDFGITFNANGFAYAKEGATATSLGTSYTTTTSFWLVRTGGSYSYYQGTTLSAAIAAGALRTVTGTTAAVYFDASVYTTGSSIDVAFTPQQIVNGANTTVAQTADGLTRIAKTGGAGNAWDADARGSTAAAGDFVLRMRPGQNDKFLAAGVSTAPGSNSSYTNLNYGVIFGDNNWTSYTESGTYAGLSHYDPGDSFWITRVGTTLRYYQGATLESAMAAGALRTLTGVTGTLYFDSSLYASSGSLDVAFTPGVLSTPEISRTDYVYDPSGRLLSRATAGQGVETFVYDGLGRITSSIDMLGAATSVAFNDGAGTTVTTLANGVTRTSTYDLAGELISLVEAGSGVATATTTYRYDGLGRLASVTDPDGRSNFLFYDAIGRKIADVDADGSATEYRYDASSNLTSTTAYANKLTSAQLALLLPPPAAVVAGTSASVVQQADGLYRLTKIGATTDWDSDARGTIAATGDFVLRLRPAQANKYLAAGVSTAPGTNASYTNFAYGMIFGNNGATYTNQGGTYTALGSYSAGDNFWIVRTGTTLTYYQGATLATATSVRTLSGATGTLYFDSSLFDPSAAIDVGFTPATIVNGANTSVSQVDGGLYRITKTAGGTGPDADGRGVVAAPGDFALELKPLQSNQAVIVGASTAPADSSGFGQIAYGIYLDFGTIWNWPAGTAISYGSYSTGDHIFMERVGSTLNYYKGATLAAARAAGAIGTVAGVSTATMYFDSTLYGVGSQFDVGFTPGAVKFDVVRPAADSTNDRWEWHVYDAAQRLVETIDGTGSVTQLAYDGTSQLVSTTQRANKVGGSTLTAMKAAAISPNQWSSPGTASAWTLSNVAQAAATPIDGSNAFTLTVQTTGVGASVASNNMTARAGEAVTFNFWVKAGTVSTLSFGTIGSPSNWGETTDTSSAVILSGPGSLTQSSGARWSLSGLSTTQATHVSVTRIVSQDETVTGLIYPNTHTSSTTSGQSIVVAQPSVVINPVAAINVPSADANDRVSRVFYDNDGRLTGTLDAEGYLTQTIYDSAGRKIRTIAYSDVADSAHPATDSFATLLAAVTTSAANDIRNQWLYDARGLLRASVDGEGTLTRYDYTAQGYVSQQVSGQKLDPTTNWTLATLPAAGGAILETVAWTYNAYGQVLTETRTLTGSTTTTTSYSYDSMRRLTATVTQSGGADARTYGQRYDAFGRLTSELSAIGNAIIAADTTPTQAEIDQTYVDYGTTYAYDAAGLLTSKTGPRGTASGAVAPKTLYYYTADGDLAYEIRSWTASDLQTYGEIVEFRYNAFGERTDTIVYSARAVPATFSTLAGGLATASIDTTLHALLSTTLDTATHVDYNVDGTVKQSTDALSNVTTYAYDAFGELITAVAPRDGSATIQTSRSYDRRGLLKQEIVDSASGGKAITTSYGYDAFGRALTLTNANSKVTTTTYDRKGRVATVKDALNNTTTYTYDARDNLVAVTDARSNVTRYVYDKANRRIATIDALGALSSVIYDADGRIVATRDYKNLVSLTGLATEVAENNTTLTSALANTDAADRVAAFAYDKNGQLRFAIDGLNHVVETVYDTRGNAIRTIAYDGTIASFTPGSVTTAWVATQVAALASAPGNRITRAIYDDQDRVSYTIDAIGQVTFWLYDAKGLLSRKVEHAAVYSTAGDPSKTDMDTWRAANVSTADDRRTYSFYDNKGQLLYSIDPQSYVTRLDYDKLGNVKAQTRYAGAYTGTFSLDALNTYYATPPSDRRLTEFNYDSAGRLEETVVYLDFNATPTVIRTRLALDQMGQILSSTEDYSASDPNQGSITAYTYDAVGRVTSMTRGSGTSEASTSYSFYDPVGNLAATVDGDKYLAVWTYDANGNALTETHYATAIATSFTTATSVATLQGYAAGSTIASSAAYDTFGRIASTTDARGSVVSRTYDVLDEVLTETEQLESGSGDDRTTTYTYDSFGDAVKVHDARGNDSFAYFDKLGRIFRQVDAEKYVTDTAYTRGSQVLTLKRYMAAATGTVSETSMPSTPAGTVATTTFGYDKLDRLVSTMDAENKTETYILNAFGDRIEFRNKLYNGTTVTRVTTYTYDKRGLMLSETLPADTLVSGSASAIVNTYTYDRRGNLTSKTEASNAPAEKRTTNYSYDKLDRLTRTEGEPITVVDDDLSTQTSVVPTETYQYDHRGNLIETVTAGIKSGWTDAHSARTVTWYDGFGRTTDQVQLVETVSSVNKGTLTRWTYDANGNALTAKTYGDLVTMPTLATDAVPTPADVNNFRLTSYTYYRDNRLKETIVAGVTTGTWDTTGGTYVVTTALVSGAPNSAADIKTMLVYDAAGNVVDQQDGRGSHVYSWYDKLGRMVAQVDTERYLTVWSRDAEGNVLSETRYADQIAAGETFTTATAVSTLIGYADDDGAHDRVTSFTYDLNGRRLTETRSGVAYVTVADDGSVATGTANSVVTYTYNALGEVLTKTEANGDTTTYGYDVAGRLVSEQGTAFKSSAWTSGAADATPLTIYTYDGLGNLTSTRVRFNISANNAADRVTSYTYDHGGRLATMTDANQLTHTYGYDAAGRLVRDSYDRATSTGTVTEASITRYDRLGRAITQTHARFASGAWTFVVASSPTRYYDATRIRYNAYGEITGRGITGDTVGPDGTPVYQEILEYDGAGRLWRSNSGDGVLRIHLYDKAGNETLTLASTGASLSSLTLSNYTDSIATSGDTGTANAVTTINVYDRRGQLTAIREPDRLLATGSSTTTVTRANAYNAFGELLSATDARGYTTSFTYNSMGRLLSRVSPEVAVVDADGTQHDGVAHGGVTYAKVAPVEYYGYDLSGRLDRVTDANGNVTRRALLAGTGHGDGEALVSKEFHADGSVFETRYDVFGDARVLRNELYYYNSATGTDNAVTSDETRAYDNLGRLLTVGHRGGALTDGYTYDILGQQLTNTETWLVSGSPVSVTAKTDYDAQGRIVRQQTLGGDVTTMAYSWSATLQALDVSGAAVANAGGWVTVTTTPNTAVTTSLSQDVFGHTVSSSDMSGFVTDYRYDLGGRTTRRRVTVGTAKDTYTYSYYNTGALAETRYTDGEPGTGTNYTLWIETYSYDASGNQLTDHLDREIGTNVAYGHMEDDHEPGVPPRFVVDGYNFVISTMTFENMSASYDSLNRMVTYDAAATTAMPEASIHYYYDANSNIRRTYATYRNIDQYGIVVTTVPPAQDYWYRYDSINRVVTAKGIQSGSTVVAGTTGTDYSYNGAGQRMTASTGFSSNLVFYVGGTMYNVGYTGAKVEFYTYAADGQVATVRIGQSTASGNSNGTVSVTPPSTGALKSSFTYDARGRLTRQRDYLADGDSDATAAYDRQLTYNSAGQVDTETVNQRQGSDTFVTTTTNSYNSIYQGYLLGALASSASVTTKGGYEYSTSTTTNYYNWRESLAIAATNIASTQINTSGTNYSTTYTYTTAGTLASAWIADGVSRGVSYVSDTLGQAFMRDEGTIAPHERWYRFGGKQLGYVGNNGTLETDYQTSINNRTTAPSGSGLFQNGATTPTSFADFDQSLDPINSYSQGGAGGSYTARGGETLAGLASQMWGDASLWYKLAELNGLTGSATLAAGQIIAIPGGVMRSTNSASTFQPYDAAQAMGDTSPTTPSPPAPKKAKKGCGIVGQILMIAIAVAVTIASHGALAHLAGAILGTSATATGAVILGGALAGMAGSFASQVFGLATGTIDKFSFKDVAMAGISGAIGAGLGQIGAVAKGAGLAAKVSAEMGGTIASGMSKLSSIAMFLGGKGVWSNVARGVLGSALTQGVAVATRLQKQFDFVGVAAAGVGAGVSASFHVPGVSSSIDNAVTGMAGGLANAATRSVLTGTDFGDNLLAALPDIIGSTVGNLVGDAITNRSRSLSPLDEDALKKGLSGVKTSAALGQSKASLIAMQRILADAPDSIANPGPVTALSSGVGMPELAAAPSRRGTKSRGSGTGGPGGNGPPPTGATPPGGNPNKGDVFTWGGPGGKPLFQIMIEFQDDPRTPGTVRHYIEATSLNQVAQQWFSEAHSIGGVDVRREMNLIEDMGLHDMFDAVSKLQGQYEADNPTETAGWTVGRFGSDIFVKPLPGAIGIATDGTAGWITYAAEKLGVDVPEELPNAGRLVAAAKTAGRYLDDVERGKRNPLDDVSKLVGDHVSHVSDITKRDGIWAALNYDSETIANVTALAFGGVRSGLTALKGLSEARALKSGAEIASTLKSVGGEAAATGAGGKIGEVGTFSEIIRGDIRSKAMRKIGSALKKQYGTKIVYNSDAVARGGGHFDWAKNEIHFQGGELKQRKGLFYEEVQHAIDYHNGEYGLDPSDLDNFELHSITAKNLAANPLLHTSDMENVKLLELSKRWSK